MDPKTATLASNVHAGSEALLLAAQDMCSGVGVNKYVPVLSLVDRMGINV
jgi:hypothetical protein